MYLISRNFYKLILELFLLKPLLWKYFRGKHTDKPSEDLSKRYFSGCFLLMRTDYFINNKGFDERFTFYHEEADLFLRVKSQCHKLIIDDEIIHFGGGGKDMSTFAFVNYYLGLFKLFHYNGIVSLFSLKAVFYLGFYMRIFLLSLGISINFTPLVAYSRRESSKSREEIIAMHLTVIKEISKH
jgi:GT2 family glycosyltransferase